MDDVKDYIDKVTLKFYNHGRGWPNILMYYNIMSECSEICIHAVIGMDFYVYCKSTNFDRYKIWQIDYFLGDNRGFSLYNPISFLSQR